MARTSATGSSSGTGPWCYSSLPRGTVLRRRGCRIPFHANETPRFSRSRVASAKGGATPGSRKVGERDRPLAQELSSLIVRRPAPQNVCGVRPPRLPRRATDRFENAEQLRVGRRSTKVLASQTRTAKLSPSNGRSSNCFSRESQTSRHGLRTLAGSLVEAREMSALLIRRTSTAPVASKNIQDAAVRKPKTNPRVQSGALVTRTSKKRGIVRSIRYVAATLEPNEIAMTNRCRRSQVTVPPMIRPRPTIR
jgi:hypothetical protein